jgi:DNA-binding NarL/FixJ family response regulator
MLNILLADDHEVMRLGVKDLLQAHPGWQVCAEASDGRQAVALAGVHHPDVAVVDVSMPELNGIETARQIRRVSGRTAVLLFSFHQTESDVADAMAAGASGFVLKSEAARRLEAAVEAVALGATCFPEKARPAGAALETRSSVPAHPPRLTPREREIAQLLAEGKSNWCVAKILGISTRTVETHRSKIMQKLGLRSVVELVHWAVRNGMVEP